MGSRVKALICRTIGYRNLNAIGWPALPIYRRTVAVAAAPLRSEETKGFRDEDQQQGSPQDSLTELIHFPVLNSPGNVATGPQLLLASWTA